MSSRRLSNVDEMMRAALAEESLLSKEKRRRWASYVVDCAVVHCAPPLAGGVSCSYAVVRVMAGDDGVVPRHHGGGVAVEVVADDDGVVPGRFDGGVAVGVAADDDGIVPGRSGGGVVAGVAADDDGVVPGRSGGVVVDGGAFEDPVKMSPTESVARRP